LWWLFIRWQGIWPCFFYFTFSPAAAPVAARTVLKFLRCSVDLLRQVSCDKTEDVGTVEGGLNMQDDELILSFEKGNAVL
jgi:hypothetical protein